ncbi:MAG: hypothetical protein EB060_03650 [Proteobacteria bacterium]|nr:hypothetical protein [Pseudomonadota bacterium]
MSIIINPYLFPSAPASSPIVSVQEVAITIGSGATSNTASITSVNTSNAHVIFNGFLTDITTLGGANKIQPRVELTSSTVVTAYRNTAGGSVTVRATVIEWDSAWIQSIQTGTITIAAGSSSNTGTVSSVTTGNSAVIYLGQTATDTATDDCYPARFATRLTLTNATTITASRGTTTSAVTVGYALVEFKSAKINSRQAYSGTIATGNTTQNVTISTVGSNAVHFSSGLSTTSGGMMSGAATSYRSSTTNVLLTRGGTDADVTVNGTIIDFTSDTVNSSSRGEDSIANTATSDTYGYTATTESKTVVFYGGYRIGSDTSFDNASCHTEVTSGTTITATRSGTSGAQNYAVEMVEFK